MAADHNAFANLIWQIVLLKERRAVLIAVAVTGQLNVMGSAA